MSKEVTISHAIVGILTTGCEKYLESTSFGMTSMWYHGTEGKIRAQKVIEFTKLPEIHDKEYVSLLLLKALLKSNSTRLSGFVSEIFIDHPTFSQIYKNTITDYSSRGVNLSRSEAILSILDKNIQVDEITVVDINDKKFLDTLIAHLGTEGPIVKGFLIVT